MTTLERPPRLGSYSGAIQAAIVASATAQCAPGSSRRTSAAPVPARQVICTIACADQSRLVDRVQPLPEIYHLPRPRAKHTDDAARQPCEFGMSLAKSKRGVALVSASGPILQFTLNHSSSEERESRLAHASRPTRPPASCSAIVKSNRAAWIRAWCAPGESAITASSPCDTRGGRIRSPL